MVSYIAAAEYQLLSADRPIMPMHEVATAIIQDSLH